MSDFGANGVRLILARAPATHEIAIALASIDPWRTLGIGTPELTRTLLDRDPNCYPAILARDEDNVGAVVIRSPWLFGPYVSLLAILPDHQGRGLGRAVLRWIESKASNHAKNVWVCASEFNFRALEFYDRLGFQQVGILSDLVRAGFDEVLLRKQLAK